jgi:hypothetical protein
MCVLDTMSFAEFPGYIDRPILHTYSKTQSEHAQMFAVSTALGVYHGRLDFSNVFNFR